MKNIVDSAVHTQVDRRIDGLSVTLIPDSRWINSDHTHVHCGMHRNYSLGEQFWWQESLSYWLLTGTSRCEIECHEELTESYTM